MSKTWSEVFMMLTFDKLKLFSKFSSIYIFITACFLAIGKPSKRFHVRHFAGL